MVKKKDGGNDFKNKNAITIHVFKANSLKHTPVYRSFIQIKKQREMMERPM